MKFTIDRNVLEKSLGRVQRIVERRNTIPILANILVKAEDSKLLLKATDLDVEIVETIDADVDKVGATTVPAHIFHDIIRKLPDGAEISIELTDSHVAVKSGRSRFSLQVLPESDFPDLSVGEWPHRFTSPAGALRKLLEKVEFAISTEETRFYLNGIYLHPVAQGNRTLMRAVATDGHRLAQAQIDAPDGADKFAGIIVPRKTVGELTKLLQPADAEATVEISDTKIRVSIGGVVLTSKLIDGTFPDYVRVIPQGNDKLLKVDRGDLRAAVDRVQTISSERGRAIKMSLNDGKLVLECSNPDSGSAVEEIGVSYAGDGIDIGFNSRYLLDVASQLTRDNVEFKFADPGSPTLITDEGELDALYVLMPMRV